MTMNTDINQIAKQTRETLKKEFPTCKFSVTVEKYSGGRCMTIALMSADFQVMENSEFWKDGYAQLNHFSLERYTREESPNGCNGAFLTQKAWDVMKRVNEIGQADNWNRSDSQSDYFDVNYYLDINIGKWNKPFQVI
jgi:hypothetical protein